MQQLPTDKTLRDVYFADSIDGWVGGDDGIFHTSDGGSNWQLQNSQFSWRISGLSASECWATGKSDTLLHTRDAGLQWDKISLRGFTDLDSIGGVGTVFFLDTSNGWAAIGGLKNTFNVAYLMKTTDGGNTWTQVPRSASMMGDHGLPIIQFIDHQIGWVMMGGESYLFGTSDSGATWDSLSYLGYWYPYDMQFISKEIGWFTSEGPVLSTYVWKTTDGGHDWFLQRVFDVSDATTYVRFTDSLNGWIAYYDLNTSKMNILHTVNGGTNWFPQLSYADTNYYRPQKVFFPDAHHGWVIGERGLAFHTSNGGGTTGVDGGKSIPNGFSLEQNFPNPFNPSTTIAFRLPARSWISIRIFNIQGQEVSNLQNGFKEAGDCVVEWNGRNELGRDVSSGVYFYIMVAIRNGETIFNSTKKMMLVR